MPVDLPAGPVRIYLPASADDVTALVEHGMLSMPRVAAAVTPTLRACLGLPARGRLDADDAEWCDHAASLLAAAASPTPGAVIVADVSTVDLNAGVMEGPGLFDLTRPVPRTAVACAFFIDQPGGVEPDTGESALEPATDGGSNAHPEPCDDATEASAGSDEVDLLWYGPTELAELAAHLQRQGPSATA